MIRQLKIALDYFILITIAAIFGGLGIIEGYYIDPAFFSQAAVIFVMFAHFVVRDGRITPEPSISA